MLRDWRFFCRDRHLPRLLRQFVLGTSPASPANGFPVTLGKASRCENGEAKNTALSKRAVGWPAEGYLVRRGNGLKLRWYREEASESAPYVSRVVWTKTLTVRVRYPSQESSNKSGVFACVGSRSVSPDMNVAAGRGVAGRLVS